MRNYAVAAMAAHRREDARTQDARRKTRQKKKISGHSEPSFFRQN